MSDVLERIQAEAAAYRVKRAGTKLGKREAALLRDRSYKGGHTPTMAVYRLVDLGLLELGPGGYGWTITDAGRAAEEAGVVPGERPPRKSRGKTGSPKHVTGGQAKKVVEAIAKEWGLKIAYPHWKRSGHNDIHWTFETNDKYSTRGLMFDLHPVGEMGSVRSLEGDQEYRGEEWVGRAADQAALREFIEGSLHRSASWLGVSAPASAPKPNEGFDPVVIGVTPAGVKWVAYSPEKVETMRANFKRMVEQQSGALHLDMLGTTWQVLEDIAAGNPSLAGRASHLKALRLKGFIRKNARSKWEPTRKGKQVLASVRTDNPIEGMPGGSVTGCIAENQDKDNPGAYCAAIADRIEPGWRKKARKNNPARTTSASDLVRKLSF